MSETKTLPLGPGRPLRVLLAGNFAPDRQQSMLRFGDLLRDGLAAAGHEVRLESPRPGFARLARPYRYDGFPKLLGYADKFVVFPARLRTAAARFQPDVVHVVDHANSACVAGSPFPALCTCHDLLRIRAAAGEIPGQTHGRAARAFQHWILGHIRRLPHAACVSENTRADLLRITGWAPDRATVIPNGLNHPYRRRSPAEAAATLAPLVARGDLPARLVRPDGFLVNVGGGQWYKNRPGLLAIHARLRAILPDRPDLVMVGKPLGAADRALLENLGPDAGVHVVVGATNAELEALYSLAAGLVFPSLAEGFGWPVAEAQACGCPVFTSDRAPLPEVGGDAAVYFDPSDSAAAAELIALAWPERERLAAAGLERAHAWSPARMIERYAALYRRLAHPTRP